MNELKQKSTFEILSAINCNDKTEKKNGLTYLSWAWAWGITKKHFPDANYKVVDYSGKPYLADNDLGYLVTTEVTINGETIPMNLPVMDGANKAQKDTLYTYEVAEWVGGKKTGKMIEKRVEAATMFDINTAIMRCLTKNLAMFGLGHYIYAGEDLPKVEVEPIDQTEVIKELQNISTENGLNDYYATLGKPKNAAIIALFTARKKEING
jgi:hypothetical protein